MAELLIRVVDKVGTDVFKDAALTKRGDVIVVRPDGWNWGIQELANPEWRIVSIPDMPMVEAEAMLAMEPGDRSVPNVLQARMFKFDLDALPGVHGNKMKGDRKHDKITLTRAILSTTKKQKDKRINPFVIE